MAFFISYPSRLFSIAPTRAAISLFIRSVRDCKYRSFQTSTSFGMNKVFKTLPMNKNARIAVLYQALEPPIINGVQKPRKPGGYQDSGADIAFNLRQEGIADVITPTNEQDPRNDSGWCFPDTEAGILSAIDAGATHLWANTILFSSHPLQASNNLRSYQDRIRVVGQPPNLVEKFDDKDYLNNLLRKHTKIPLPRAWTVNANQDLSSLLSRVELPFPIVAKPARGRGSHGVKVCETREVLNKHMEYLLEESPVVILEEFLAGEEATITVMPSLSDAMDYWAMPIITRFNHQENIAPYNGAVAVTANSRVITKQEAQNDSEYEVAARQCVNIARLLSVTAPIRVDIRRYTDYSQSNFAIFDVNMKPNMTGPGRPGRKDQASLTAMAAKELGWDYQTLLSYVLRTARTIEELRSITPKLS